MSESGRTQGRSESPRRDDDPDEGSARITEQVARPLLDDVDGLLDEIDAVLEVNAEEFVRGYVQKGGE
jgi:ubiquitin-like protein Pup